MMLLEMLPQGERLAIGSYEFDEDNIVRFAREFDPHSFHTDPEAAKDSLFGGLCASGWHVCSAAMKCFITFMMDEKAKVAARGGEPPKTGPSPGFRNLRWIRPAFVGDTGHFFLTIQGSEPIPNKPGRNMCALVFEGENQNGEAVLRFEYDMIAFA